MEKALFQNNLIKKITAALMIVMLLIPYCFAQVTFGDNKSDLKNAQNQQNDIQNKKKETEDKISQLKAQSSEKGGKTFSQPSPHISDTNRLGIPPLY